MKIMIVDDQFTVLQSLKEAIEPSGHDCVCFDNPEIALQNFTAREFDTVITDYKMPHMNGIELLCAIQKYKPGTPVIMFTGYAEVNNIIEAVNYGVFAFFRKPVNIREMMVTLEKIKNLVERRKRLECEHSKLVSLDKMHFLEVQHRVRNNLQTISSLLSLQINLQPDNESLSLLKTHQNRIKVIGLSYELMNQSRHDAIINCDEFFQKIVDYLLLSHVSASSKVKLFLELDKVKVPVDQAIPIGLALNEVISNALIHAFPDDWVGDAHLIVSLKQCDDEMYINVQDNGVGLAGIDPTSSGTMGFTLVHTLIVNQLGGQVLFNCENGTSVTFLTRVLYNNDNKVNINLPLN